MYFTYHSVFYLLTVCYFMFFLCQLSKTLSRFQTKEDLEVASQYISDAIRDFYEMNCSIRLTNTPTCVPWWRNELSKVRFGVRKQFNRVRKTNMFCDWKRFKEAQHIYKRQMAQKGTVGKHSVQALRVPHRHPCFTEFLAKKLMT